MNIQEIISRWNTGEGKPYKGSLIDWEAYGGDGDEAPDSISCLCAQGQVLHLLGGWSPRRLNEVRQIEADRETAKLLNISVAHAILLRKINDSVDGAPSIVLTHPEKILGDQAHIILAFWRHLDRLSPEGWKAVIAARAAAWAAAWAAAGAAAGAAARDAARDTAWAAAGAAAGDAAGACSEIQGAKLMRERGQPFFFLPMFGFNAPEDIPQQSSEERSDTSK